MTTPALRPHHDGSPLYVSHPAPVLGDEVDHLLDHVAGREDLAVIGDPLARLHQLLVGHRRPFPMAHSSNRAQGTSTRGHAPWRG